MPRWGTLIAREAERYFGGHAPTCLSSPTSSRHAQCSATLPSAGQGLTHRQEFDLFLECEGGRGAWVVTHRAATARD
jgi:hypothetical protein